MVGFYQKISRNNDVNGNPYRLILIYDNEAMLKQVWEVNTSMTSGKELDLRRQGYVEITPIHVTIREYKVLKRELYEQYMGCCS